MHLSTLVHPAVAVLFAAHAYAKVSLSVDGGDDDFDFAKFLEQETQAKNAGDNVAKVLEQEGQVKQAIHDSQSHHDSGDNHMNIPFSEWSSSQWESGSGSQWDDSSYLEEEL